MEKKLIINSVHVLLKFASLILLHSQMAIGQTNMTIPVKVGVVVDMDVWIGQMGLNCISIALSDIYASNTAFKTRLVLNPRDSKGDDIGAAAAALDLLKNVEVQAIIGPLSSMQADFTIDLGEKAHVPIISFSATSPSLSTTRSPYFIRATHNDSSQVKAISSLVKAFGWREVVPIYVDNEFGEGIIPILADALGEVNARIPYRSVISPSATDDQLATELYKLMTMQTRVFIVHVSSKLGARLFIKANEINMLSEGYAWIITDSLANWLNSFDPFVINSMQGVIGVKAHVPQTKELESFNKRWRSLKFQENNQTLVNPELNVFGLWAYDSAIALAMAMERAGVTNLGFQKPNKSESFSELETGVSSNGPMLLQEILNTNFRGLSGDFRLINGQLQSSAYQIVNVIGKGAKEIGFWTEENGIVRELNAKHNNKYSTERANLGAIVWPGDTTAQPKGWIIPTNGKKLRVLVPPKVGFSEFVRVNKDPSTNRTTVTGYCIEVFDTVIASLPYSIQYEYFVFSKSDGKIAGNYNDLVYQVHLGNYDVAVGDITIVANRSQYVDFTLPFTESGVSMVVRVKDNDSENPWVFLKPLTWNLWLATFVSFIILGLLVWTFEHRINEEFREGPLSHKIGTTFWFAFSTMVFAHKEKIASNYTRIVLIIWFFVVLILTQAYTASLTSMLTVQKLQPTITSINELIRNNECVGYQRGSFILGFLKQMGFDESRLLEYTSPDQLDQLFTNGSKNGGIAAAFDEIPYTKVFLSTYPSKYTMVKPTYKIDGFGFVFPIGSPLVTDVSRAILNVTEGEKMIKIENAWFPQSYSSPDSNAPLPSNSNSLGLDSFSGLFVIVATTSALAFIIYLLFFMHEHWDIIKNHQVSIGEKFDNLMEKFHDRDTKSHTFRSIGLRINTGKDSHGNEEMFITSPDINRVVTFLLQGNQQYPCITSSSTPPPGYIIINSAVPESTELLPFVPPRRNIIPQDEGPSSNQLSDVENGGACNKVATKKGKEIVE